MAEQPRDNNGRWTNGGGGAAESSSSGGETARGMGGWDGTFRVGGVKGFEEGSENRSKSRRAKERRKKERTAKSDADFKEKMAKARVTREYKAAQATSSNADHAINRGPGSASHSMASRQIHQARQYGQDFSRGYGNR